MKFWISIALATAPLLAYSFEDAQAFLKQHCEKCHGGAAGVGGFRLQRIAAPTSLRDDAAKWNSLIARVRNGEMPPKGAPAPSLEAREGFAHWAVQALRNEACASGPAPGPSPIRRLNRDEYAATIRDLFDMHLDLGSMLPADGAGGEGFDNAAETLFLSPLHAEKYMDAAKFVMDFAAKEYKTRVKIFVAKPGAGVSEEQAARKILANFLPKAFRHPVDEKDAAPYAALYNAARKQGQAYEPAVLFSMRAALVSPMFLFRADPPNSGPEPRLIDAYSLASRISYFLWGSMPDELLTDVAASGGLQDPEVLQQLVKRMLRNDRSLIFAQRFAEQWLRTRELTAEKAPDAKLYAAYAADAELRGDVRFQPILFLRELMVRDLSLLNLIDSKFTIGTAKLEKHFGVKLPLKTTARNQQQWVELPEGSNRGGVLGMPAVLAVSSYPYRTSPVLRGAFILDSILGTPPPPPPPNVPPLEETKSGESPKSVRERLSQHRENPVCASCHARIDPIGFALENYDPVGHWRDQDAGKPVDSSGELMDGTKFAGPAGLKQVLLDRKDLFIRNFTAKMLGYALGRGLTLKDSCTVDNIAEQLKANDYRAGKLAELIVLSQPFRYQTGTPAASRKEQGK